MGEAGEQELKHRRSNVERPASLDLQSKGRKQVPVIDETSPVAAPQAEETNDISGNTFWLTRIVFLRSLGFLYGVAFLMAYHQNKQLVGDNGLLPMRHLMENIYDTYYESKVVSFLTTPTILWWAEPWHNVNPWLDTIALVGLAISLLVVVTGAANVVAMALLWLLYHSVVNVGQNWYGFGWESQLLETGFLSIWLVPLFSWRQLPSKLPSPKLVVWGNRWLLFRIMIGAGLIKLRGDSCWWKLTCMHYHYETQPVPNPISFYLHFLPGWWHRLEVVGNHLVELLVPWFMFSSRPLQIACGVIQITFQVILIVSGNLSFLNWLTILPSIWLFDDRFLAPLFFSGSKKRVAAFQQEDAKQDQVRREGKTRQYVHKFIALVIAYMSVPVVLNLLSPWQKMNTSFEPFRIVNTYGAFGSITKQRSEVILQGTYAEDSYDPGAEWMEYEFKCKPGNVSAAPCLISPYHYRLDWLMWFAAFQDYQYNPWLVHLVLKLLQNDPDATSLLAHNPFEGKEPPTYIRAEHYHYKFARPGTQSEKRGQWWTRHRYEPYLVPLNLKATQSILHQLGYPNIF